MLWTYAIETNDTFQYIELTAVIICKIELNYKFDVYKHIFNIFVQNHMLKIDTVDSAYNDHLHFGQVYDILQ